MSDGVRDACVARLRSGDRLLLTKGVHAFGRRLCVKGLRDIVIEGEDGAVIRTHCDPSGPESAICGAFLLSGCTNVTVRNLRVTTDGFIGNQGEVVGKDETAHTLLFKVDAGFPVTGKEHYFQLNTVEGDGVPDGALEVHTPIHEVAGRHVGLDYEVVGDRLVRIRVPERAGLACVTNGHRMLVRYFRIGEEPFVISGCAGVTIEDVEIERTANLGMRVEPPTRDLVLRRFNVRPAKGSGLYAASNSDAVHILGCSGRFTMEDCHFKGLGDDALNIHSMAAEVKTVDADGNVRLILRGPDRSKELRLPPNWGVAGNELEVYDSAYGRRGKLVLKSYDERTNAGVVTVREGMLPRPGDLLVNASFYPSVRIKDCTFENTRARAVLLQTHDVRIENCFFRGFPLPAIIFAVDFVVWNEAGPTENAEVAGCRFERCARTPHGTTLGAIVVKADHDGGENDRPSGIHRNLRFLNNRFSDCGSSGIYVAATDGVELDGNVFAGCSANPHLEPYGACDIRLKNCTNVRLGTNTSDRGKSVKMDGCTTASRPPRVRGPEAWLEFMGGNVRKDGLRCDLEAIRAAGFSGVHFFHIERGGAWPGCPEQIPCLSAKWNDLMSFLGSECKRLDLKLTVQNCPGWSQSGGPWIDLDHCQRHIRFARKDFAFGEAFRLPPVPAEFADGDSDWRDIAVLAFPTLEGDEGDAFLAPQSVEKDGTTRIFRFAEPVTVRSLVLPGLDTFNSKFSYETPWMRVALDVQTPEGWREVVRSSLPTSNWRDYVETFTLACGETTGCVWRYRFEHDRPIVNYGEPRLSSVPRMTDWEGKSARTLRSLLPASAPVQSRTAWIDSAKVVDLTGKSGWTVPEGRWTVLRLGHVNAKYVNAPAPKEATGWECDKLDPSGIEAHFDGYVRKLAEGPLKGTLSGFLVDSWECFGQTWTPKMERYFKDANGYALRPWLPALFGWIVGSPSETEAFLTDWRRTNGDLVTKNYYGRMAELARAAGLSVIYETAFGDIIPGDLLEYWKHADEPMCEFWFPHVSRDEGLVGTYAFKPILPCASAAHIYGKSRVTAEAFTGWGITWREDFKSLRDVANRHFAKGVTHLAVQSYTHAPQPEALPPGGCMGGYNGTPFTRLQTWWKHMPAFTGWLRECEDRLEAGLPVADVLWYLGDAVDHKPDEYFAFPEGFRADYLNYDVLVNRLAVRERRFVIPEGSSWRILWVPDSRFLRPASKASLAQLAAEGGTVVYGDKAALKRALAELEKDVATDPALGDEPSEDFVWCHRKENEVDRYFVAAGTNGWRGKVTFRAKGAVSIFDPVSNERFAWRNGDELVLLPSQSVFVEFGVGGMGKREWGRGNREWGRGKRDEVKGWTLRFAPGWDAPETVVLDKLVPWSEIPGFSPAARAYSGTVVYETTFAAKGDGMTLDLGRVESIAEVFVNGRKVRTLWCEPYVCDISDFVREGSNELRIEVTGVWHNRVFFDQTLPEKDRKTWTIYTRPPRTDILSEFIPQGLLGPVCTIIGKGNEK